jgi:hypothetical protein
MKKILLLFFLMTISLGFAQPGASPSDPPARNAWDIFSMYSDSYSNQSGVQFLTFGGSTINADYTPAGGNPSKYYTGHSYSGIQVNTAGSLDISQMTHLHFDVWSPNFNSMAIKLESSTTTARELSVTGTVVPSASTRNQWISIDLDLSTYNLGNILTSLKYIVPVTFGQNATLYIDNIYFYRPATTSQPPTFGTFTVPAKLVGDSNFTITAPSTNSNGAFTYTSSNTAVATIVSGNQIHIVGAGSSVITASQAASGSLVAGSTTATLNVTYPPMTTDAPAAPARNAWDVVSLYSSTYTDLTGINWFPNWGQATTHSTYTPSANETHLYQNLNYEGVQLAGNTDISAMTTLHVDIYSPDATALDFRIISGGEFNKTLTLVPGQWNSFDIPLSQYTGANLTVLNQLKFQTNPFGALRNIVYLDNVYFYRPATALPSPSLSNFTVASQAIGSSSFTLTDPTSNSAGTFSYTSSNTSVATVSGNTVTVLALGSTTITATQAGTDSYSSGTITALFDVTPAAAPTPTVDASHVISLFSDAYTNVSGTNWFPNWGQSTVVSEVSIGGNATKKYTNLNYEGVQFTGVVNASAMVSLHMDIWTPDCTSLEFHLINQPAPDQGITLTPTLSGWNSFDILLSQFTNINLANIGQFKFVGTPSGSTVYLDNIYFSDVPVTVAPIISGFSVPSKELGVADFNLTAPTSSSAGAFTYTSSNTNVATIIGNTVTVVGIGTTTITATQEAAGSYLSGFVTANLVVITPLPTAPDTAAPTPPARNTGDVKSLFSDAYSNVSGTDWFPNWGQSTTMQDITIGGNNTKIYSNMNYQGVNFASAVNASAMTKLHIDIWSSTCTAFDVYPIVPGQPEQKVTLTPTIAGWSSFDIDLTQYTIPLTNITQMKFAATPSGTKVFLDNIYFWKPDTTPNITGFNVPSKLIGSAPFALTAPSSNSSGAFTYTSSNTNVATIVGNTVTIVGVGSTTITATQAAAAPYFAGFTSATLLVSYPGPTSGANAPTLDASRVISLYSNTYTNVSNIDWFPNWGQLTQVTNTTAGGNDVKKYTTMNYQGVQFATPIDATAMTHLHLDIWTPNCTAFDVYLINQTIAEQKVTLTPTMSGWNSFDIPLYQYSNINLASVGQLKFVSAPYGTGELYLDNIYFSKPVAALSNALCGGTLVALDSNINATYISGYQAYRFEVSNGTTINTVDVNKYNFSLTQTPGITYGTTYGIRVAVQINGVWGEYGPSCNVTTPTLTNNSVLTTKINPTFCGTTLANLDTKIAASIVQNATIYRFEITTGGVTTVYDSSSYNFRLADAGVAAYGTTYTIRVAALVNGVYGNYGASCNVTTPTLTISAIPTTKVLPAFCGTTLATLDTKIGATLVSGATGYRFEIITGGVTTVYDSATYNFKLSQAGVAAYGTTYAIRVAALVNGTYGNYGASCNVSTPVLATNTVPTTTIQPSFCGATLAALDTKIGAVIVAGATKARFEVTIAGGSPVVYEVAAYNFRLSQTGVAVLYNTDYSIRVAAFIGGVWGNYGASCTVTTPAAPAPARLKAKSFEVSAYPNPFDTAFNLSLETPNKEDITIAVYDMMGKLVETHQVNPMEVANLQIGNNFAAGIYNVIVSQANEMQAIRLIRK